MLNRLERDIFPEFGKSPISEIKLLQIVAALKKVQGREALKLLEKYSTEHDVIFMDWQMPVMDEHETIKRIRQKGWDKTLRIVALTANAIQGDKEKCLNVGANDYMSKPVRVQETIDLFTASSS